MNSDNSNMKTWLSLHFEIMNRNHTEGIRQLLNLSPQGYRSVSAFATFINSKFSFHCSEYLWKWQKCTTWWGWRRNATTQSNAPTRASRTGPREWGSMRMFWWVEGIASKMSESVAAETDGDWRCATESAHRCTGQQPETVRFRLRRCVDRLWRIRRC